VSVFGQNPPGNSGLPLTRGDDGMNISPRRCNVSKKGPEGERLEDYVIICAYGPGGSEIKPGDRAAMLHRGNPPIS
jgi:hypothetical protein